MCRKTTLQSNHQTLTPAHIDFSQLSLTIDGVPVLRDISLSVPAGCLVGIIGPNGAGKSSLLRTVYCHRYDQDARLSGSVCIGGQPVYEFARRELAKKVAVVLQEASLPFELSVADVIAMGLTPHKSLLSFTTKADRLAVREAAKQVDLEDKLQRDFGALSGGEKQRALIARAIIQRPEILLLDEPTNHLDIQHQIEILALVRSLGITVLLSIHDLNMAAAYCDQLVVLNQGRLVDSGTVEEVLTSDLIRDVFHVGARVTQSRSGPVNITYDMSPLTAYSQSGARSDG